MTEQYGTVGQLMILNVISSKLQLALLLARHT